MECMYLENVIGLRLQCALQIIVADKGNYCERDFQTSPTKAWIKSFGNTTQTPIEISFVVGITDAAFGRLSIDRFS